MERKGGGLLFSPHVRCWEAGSHASVACGVHKQSARSLSNAETYERGEKRKKKRKKEKRQS
jgi:hypothetical protein